VGYGYARSPELLQTGVLSLLRWLRMVGDTVFGFGAFAFAFAAFIVRLALVGRSKG